ncbi:MAG: ACP S-malonyltransferase [Candidatus Obscuribacterales bacterium]|nr:ACP S-malonyltransferase [Candidatus Obscuribacterales bacterium]
MTAGSTASKAAFLFPGQGAHCVNMLDGLTDCPAFADRYALLVKRLGVDPLTSGDDLALINSNKVSSLLTVLASSLSLDLLREQNIQPSFVAGYSVGQWTALYAAGCLDFASLVDVVYTRATFMDECFADRSGGMVAVIGLPLQVVEGICSEVRESGSFLTVSNFNCVGQYSLAGDAAAVDLAIAKLEGLSAKKVQRLPVAGAWHCDLLAKASERFEHYLQSVPLVSPSVPVCDNVTGEELPADQALLKSMLARQISVPVQWEKCIQHLCTSGCTEFIEVGFGNVLTKFGFFINRKVAHKSFYTGGDGG